MKEELEKRLKQIEEEIDSYIETRNSDGYLYQLVNTHTRLHQLYKDLDY